MVAVLELLLQHLTADDSRVVKLQVENSSTLAFAMQCSRWLKVLRTSCFAGLLV